MRPCRYFWYIFNCVKIYQESGNALYVLMLDNFSNFGHITKLVLIIAAWTLRYPGIICGRTEGAEIAINDL